VNAVGSVRGLLTAFVLLASGCGPHAVVWVRVEAPFLVPSECDAVRLTAVRASDEAPLFEQSYDLGALGVTFPLEVSLTNANRRNLGDQSVLLTAEAFHGTVLAAPWARTSVAASVLEGQVTESLVRLCDCP
jgi:hypothetical protein